MFDGTVEVDETYMGGLEKNKHKDKKLRQGRGATGKTAVIGVKERDTKKVKAQVIENTKRPTLHNLNLKVSDNRASVISNRFERAAIRPSAMGKV